MSIPRARLRRHAPRALAPLPGAHRVIELLDCSRPAAGKAIRALEAARIVRPMDERKKNRTVVFEDYLAHLRQGTELSV